MLLTPTPHPGGVAAQDRNHSLVFLMSEVPLQHIFHRKGFGFQVSGVRFRFRSFGLGVNTPWARREHGRTRPPSRRFSPHTSSVSPQCRFPSRLIVAHTVDTHLLFCSKFNPGLSLTSTPRPGGMAAQDRHLAASRPAHAG